jgi:hypothetical protein
LLQKIPVSISFETGIFICCTSSNLINKQQLLINMKHFIFLFLFLFLGDDAVAQNTNSIQLHLFGGLSCSFGTKVNKIGVTVGGALWYQYVQVNTQYYAYHCFNNLGPQGKRSETQLHLGILGAFGKIDSLDNAFFDALSNQTKRKYAVAYAYKIYNDKIGTSQKSGAIGFCFGKVRFITENDLLAGKGSDKYRTGAFLFDYTHNNWQFVLNNILWTSNPKAKGSHREKNNPNYPSRFGYYNCEGTPFSQYSHGILAAQVKFVASSPTLLQLHPFDAQIGIDDERIRNLIQNKLIHDMPLVPRKWNKANNPHVPMIDANGKPYLYQPNQQIRFAKVFAEVGCNSSMFY